jgi:4-amino-4-deoxy-L-arabinose transferase-like glycosyltransferase
VPAPSDPAQPARGRHRHAPEQAGPAAVTFSQASHRRPGDSAVATRHGDGAALRTRPADLDLADHSASAPVGPDRALAPGQPPAGVLDRLLASRGWPIVLILAAQVALSGRLVWRTTAFIDEALYLSVGHLELAHLFHHAPMPEVASYMSGSPLVYPPLAAAADEVGGLAGARLLSLAFILLATFLLHGVAKRLMSSATAAFFAAALFAGIAPAQFLSAFATYDAMALALLALATWLGVRAVECETAAARYLLLGLGGGAIMIADAAKYAATIFDPVVIAVVGLAMWRVHGRRAGLDAGGAMLLAAVVPLAVGYDLAGASFATGVSSTTLARASGTSSTGAVLSVAVQATGVVIALTILGVVLIALRRPSAVTLALVCVLAAAEWLAPAEQARIHTTTSLFKHVGYGAWFGCVVAGFLLSEWAAGLARVIAHWRASGRASSPGYRARPSWALAISAIAVITAGVFGTRDADTQYAIWPNSTGMTTALARYVQPGGYYLVEGPSVVNYYLRKQIPFLHVDGTYYFTYTDAKTGQRLVNNPAYALAIKHGFFRAIVISFGITPAVDGAVVRAVDADKDYRLAAVVPYRDAYGPNDYQIWVRIHRARH